LRDGHPWVFSGSVARVEGATDAPLARVFDSSGRALGLGFWSPRSQIRVRMLGGGSTAADHSFFAARLAEAATLRSTILPPETTGYRLFNAEGDGVPGWTVDRFGSVLVSQVTVAGLEATAETAYGALAEAQPGCDILQINALPARRAEGLPVGASEWIRQHGEARAEAEFTESGLRFSADLEAGQKTGFYCDQRENRRLAERLAGGRAVLDLFAHAGAFGLYALRGGARSVTAVESSPRLIERGHQAVAANRLDDSSIDWVKADVWADLRSREQTYGMVICDPPPLVRKRKDLDAAARAYKDLNRLALSRLEPGGLLLTFSCSGAVDTKLFRQILFSAAVEARRRVALLEPLAAAPDHPVAITHPQGEYLKGWLAIVRGEDL
jgi:23S rRNA (cytosine1962-C5)-methyltransferase